MSRKYTVYLEVQGRETTRPSVVGRLSNNITCSIPEPLDPPNHALADVDCGCNFIVGHSSLGHGDYKPLLGRRYVAICIGCHGGRNKDRSSTESLSS